MKTRLLTILTIFITITYSFGQSRKDSLFVFVGEIIEVKDYPYEKEDPKDSIITIHMDSRYLAKYKVLKSVYGTFTEDTIEFIVYDHYGKPAFSKFKTVLLFVSNYKGQLYHEKYQYFDVYITKDNRWASPGDPYKFDDYHRKDLKPQKIEFKEKVSYDIGQLDKDRIKKSFPKEYFNIVRKKAYPLMGTYIEDLFTVKKEGVLKARGIF
ncbi:MAG: hypothetical protein KF803_11515 [Cyclobacteriaceae bacterium]|nr:hypothetical protein [Cyclobacteriaceae bacterium]